MIINTTCRLFFLLLISNYTVAECGALFTAISAIQGVGDQSPLQNKLATTEGVVTQKMPLLKGFFIQSDDADQDQNPDSSEALFVYHHPFNNLTVGDRIRIAAKVSEYHGNTQLSGVRFIERCGLGRVQPYLLPGHSNLPLEALENMQVRLPAGLQVLGNQSWHRFGVLSVGQPDQSPWLLDDGSYQRYSGSHWQRVRRGASVPELQGVLTYAYDQFRIHADTAIEDWSTDIPRRPEKPEWLNDSDALKILSWNMENFFLWPARSNRAEPTEAEFARRKDKWLNTLLTADADLVALIEVENQRQSLQQLANWLNEQLPTSKQYQVVFPLTSGPDQITQGILYRPERVEVIGQPMTWPMPARIGLGRPILGQRFSLNGSEFIVLVNHWPSKRKRCSAQDPVDNFCAGLRQQIAFQLLEQIEQHRFKQYLLLGDLNSAPGQPGYNVLNRAMNDLFGAEEYSYVYRNNSVRLDHIFAAPKMVEWVVASGIWKINADENELAMYSQTIWRSSDHDPVWVQIRIPPHSSVE